MAHEENVDALTREIRIGFHRLRAVGDALHAGLGVTAAMRGVMETLYERGPATVPQIARRKTVSRQHIQALVNALWERKLCVLVANPAHARSSVVTLSDQGRALFETLREGEQSVLAELASELSTDVATAVSVLRRLNAALLRRLPDQEEAR